METHEHRDSRGGELFAAFRRDALGVVRKMAEAGDISRVDAGSQPVFLLNHPDLIRDVLVTRNASFSKVIGIESVFKLLGGGMLTAEGEAHRKRRRLAQPAFHKQRIASYAGTMVDHAVEARERWEPGVATDVAHEMMRITLGVAGRTLFDSELEGDAKEVADAMGEISELSNLVAFPFIKHIEKFELFGRRRFDKAQARLDAAIYRIIAECRASARDRGDLLSMLIQASDEEGDADADRHLRDEVMTIFLASYDTTANALTWTWHLLSQHPEVEARMHEEIDSVLGDRPPTLEDLPQLKYVEQVLTESMRIFPPVWLQSRKTLEEYPVGDTVIPKGAIVFVSQYLMHRDPRFFDDPETFRPERWTAEMKAALPRFAYFPFGGGPRQCIGEGFAWMEATLVIATIAQRWRFRPVEGFAPELQPLFVLRPKNGLFLIPELRYG